MSILIALSPAERKKFDEPPKFTKDERAFLLSLTNNELQMISGMRTPTNKVGFILQLAYFKANAKFYPLSEFKEADIDFVTKTLAINAKQLDLSLYHSRTITEHRKRILEHLTWKMFDAKQEIKLKDHAKWLVQRQFSLKNLFCSIVDFCWKNKIEVPSYNIISTIISNAYDHFESGLTKMLAQKLTKNQTQALNDLVEPNEVTNKIQISLLKKINQSVNPADLKETIDSFATYKSYFVEFKTIIEDLNLSDQATEYFATWVRKSLVSQVQKISNKNKLYLYLLCYIKHQLFVRHDILADIYLKSVQSHINSARKHQDQKEKENRIERNKAIKECSAFNKTSMVLVDKISETIHSNILTDSGKVSKVKDLIDEHAAIYNEDKSQQIIKLEETLNALGKESAFFESLENVSIRLQHRVSNILKVVEFNINSNMAYSNQLMAAIEHFVKTNGDLNAPPCEFLTTEEKEAIYKDEKLRVSLYKIILFNHIANAIKSGHLNVKNSYRYKAIDEYLISKKLWNDNKNNLIEAAGLLEFSDLNATKQKLKDSLNNKYKDVNEHIIGNKSSFFKIDEKGKIKLQTPKTDSDESEYVGSILSQAGFIPIIQILSDINQVAQFTSCFKHFSVKYKKMDPDVNVIYAGIIGKGCNIGLNRIAKISSGISDDVLKNVVSWCFSIKNIQAANNKIISMTNKLLLSSLFKHTSDETHTSSDGQKINVSVSSLHSTYSYKYFGKGKGVSVYTFIDERQSLFHSTVISSSEREAAYVIDGLLQNDVIKSTIHSTDTHGFSETVFATSYFINTAFAPRIKKVTKQRLYGLSSKQFYDKKTYKILPDRIINFKLIETNWDDILRFMATIKLKHNSASLLFKRLSSYAKDHPLYKALKEFGRIIKTIFILTYFDDKELRQRIQKQLNKVEMSNKFSKAIFFSNNHEFKHGTKEDQEISTACKVLIQNAIVLWNYLYLSNFLANNADLNERSIIANSITRGSVMAWQHVNLQGEYDFTKTASNDSFFDLEKIMSLKLIKIDKYVA